MDAFYCFSFLDPVLRITVEIILMFYWKLFWKQLQEFILDTVGLFSTHLTSCMPLDVSIHLKGRNFNFTCLCDNLH